MLENTNFLDDIFYPVLNAPTVEAFRDELIAFGRSIGFDTVMADFATPLPDRKWFGVNNFPTKWAAVSKSFIDEPKLDVTPQRTDVWSVMLCRAKGFNKFADALTTGGLFAGFDVPVHSHGGAYLHLCFSRDQAMDLNTEETLRAISRAQLFAGFAMSACERLYSPAITIDVPSLSDREHEVLVLTAIGKTAYEIGMIFGITERTANFHIGNILRKLNVVNKAQAVVRAMQLKIIS